MLPSSSPTTASRVPSSSKSATAGTERTFPLVAAAQSRIGNRANWNSLVCCADTTKSAPRARKFSLWTNNEYWPVGSDCVTNGPWNVAWYPSSPTSVTPASGGSVDTVTTPWRRSSRNVKLRLSPGLVVKVISCGSYNGSDSTRNRCSPGSSSRPLTISRRVSGRPSRVTVAAGVSILRARWLGRARRAKMIALMVMNSTTVYSRRALMCLRPPRSRRPIMPSGLALIGSPARNRSMSSAKSCAVWYRRSGAFSIALRQIVSTSRWMRRLILCGDFGSSRSTFWIISITLEPPNAGRPVNISYKVTPSEKMSERASASAVLPAACSGDMYRGVPMTWPVIVRLSSSLSTSLARPKSVTLIRPLLSIRMLPGLMSRWTTPLSCA